MEGGSILPLRTNATVKFGARARRQTLVDITNTLREGEDGNSGRYLQVIKENAQLLNNIAEKSKLIQVYKQDVEKLKIALQGSRQQNWQLAETNSQMLAELNSGKDRLKNLQHELKCTTLALEQKELQLQEKQRMNKQLQQQIKAQEKDASIGGKRKNTDIQITVQVHQEAPRRTLDDRKPIRRQSMAKAQTIRSSNVQSVKAASTTTRRKSVVPNSGVHMEEDKGINTDVEKDMIIPLKTEPEPEMAEPLPLLTQKEMTHDDSAIKFLSTDATSGTRWLAIKEENTDVCDSSNVGVATDATSGPRPSLVAARRSSLSRPLPLRRAVEKVVSYREPPVNIKMRRVAD